VDSSFSTSGTRRVISEEWTVPSLLVAPVVLFLGATSREGTVHSSEVTRRVPLVEKELPTLQNHSRFLVGSFSCSGNITKALNKCVLQNIVSKNNV
jgi:hypothetical protein